MALQRATFAPTQPQACAVSIATPGVVTLANHGFLPDQEFVFQTTGGLPTGITMVGSTLLSINYYVLSTGWTTGAFQFSASRGGAAINTSGTQSGVQSVVGIINNLSSGQDLMANSPSFAIASDQAWPAFGSPALPTTLVSSWQAKASAGGLLSFFCNITTVPGWVFIVDATSVANGIIVPIWSAPIDSNGTHGNYEQTFTPSPLKFNTGCVACFSTTGPTASNVTLTLSATAFFGGQVQ